MAANDKMKRTLLAHHHQKIATDAVESAARLGASQDFINVLKYLHVLSGIQSNVVENDSVAITRKQGRADLFNSFIYNLDLDIDTMAKIHFHTLNVELPEVEKKGGN